MKPFKFYFDGHAVPSISGGKDEMSAGFKVIEGDREMIGRALGTYASNAFKQLKQPDCAAIIVIAYWEFRRLNPELTESMERALGGDSLIIKPYLKYNK